jgi:hypothetical protein
MLCVPFDACARYGHVGSFAWAMADRCSDLQIVLPNQDHRYGLRLDVASALGLAMVYQFR